MSVDSLSWDVAKLIIQYQHNLAVIGISVAVIIVGIQAFLSWRESKKTAESLKSEITTKAEEVFGKVTERLDKREEISQKLDKLPSEPPKQTEAK